MNWIGADGVKAFADVLKTNTALTTLDLGCMALVVLVHYVESVYVGCS